jgi:hypothetical protein
MFSPVIAKELTKNGVDAVAIVADPALNALPDARLLEISTESERCLVTENVRDFERLRRAWSDRGEVPAGLLCVSAARFPRTPSAARKIIDVLAKFAEAGRIPSPGGMDWLA